MVHNRLVQCFALLAYSSVLRVSSTLAYREQSAGRVRYPRPLGRDLRELWSLGVSSSALEIGAVVLNKFAYESVSPTPSFWADFYPQCGVAKFLCSYVSEGKSEIVLSSYCFICALNLYVRRNSSLCFIRKAWIIVVKVTCKKFWESK